MLILDFANQTAEKIDRQVFEALFEKGCRVLKSSIQKIVHQHESALGLILVNDEYMQMLNFRNLGKDAPTDVLSFRYYEDKFFPRGEKLEGLQDLVGEIYISAETARRQASEKGHSLEYELQFLFVHGFLHVFGFDHGTTRGTDEMNKYGKMIFGVDVA